MTVDTGGANSNVRIRLGLRNGNVQTTADAPFLRQDHPSKLVFALTVVASHSSTGTFCVGGFCGSDSILLNTATASPSIVAASDGANANRNYDAEFTTWKIDGSTTGLTGGVCDRHPAVRDAIVAAQPGAGNCAGVTDLRLTAILELNVSQKSIASLRKEDFAGLTKLRTLNLSGNDLDHLADDLFEPLTSLRTLNLSGNDLDRLADDLFERLTSLRTLNLAENDLTAFPAGALDDVGGTLEDLFLRDNAIATIGAGALDGLTALRRLELRGNDLTALPAGVFDRTTQLRELRLANNALASLPDDLLAPLTLLETVWLTGNPGFDGFAPVVEDIPARTAPRGQRVDLAAATGASPWGDNVTWSWARTDTNGGTATLQDADTATPYFTAPSPSADTELTFEATATGRGTTGSGVSAGSATARVTVPGPPRIVDIGVTSRPADDSTTFKRGDRIEVTVTFSEPVRKSGSGNVVIYMWGNDALMPGRIRMTAELDRQDHPERLIFAVTVPANVTDWTSGSFCIGGSPGGALCVDFADEIETRNNASIVARSDGANADISFSALLSGFSIDGTTAAQTGIVCHRHPAVRAAITDAVPTLGPGDCDQVLAPDLANITSLDISGENIDSLRKADFDGLTGLTTLNLSDNDLDYLKEDLFEGVTALTTLDLRKNDLAALPARVFDGLTALTTLDLRQNGMAALPARVFDGLTALTTLELGQNGMAALPAGVFDGLTALTTLDLRQNAIAALPAGVFDALTELRVLRLVNNRLAALPDGVFEALTKLETLWLTGNPGYDGFVPAVKAIAAQAVRAGDRVELEASAAPSPWGANVAWSWAQTDTSGTTVTLVDADEARVHFETPATLEVSAELVIAATATGRGTKGLGTPLLATAEAAVTVTETVPPELLSAGVGTSGDTVTLVFSEDLDTAPGLPAAGAFTVTADGAAVAVQSVTAPATDTLALGLPAEAIGARQIVTVSYAVPASAVIADAAGNAAAAFAGQPVTNSSTVANTTPPVLVSASVSASGRNVLLTFNEILDIAQDRLPPAGAFTVTADGVEVAVQPAVTGVSNSILALVVPVGTIAQGQSVTVSYAVPASGTAIQDAERNRAAAFADRPATNHSEVPPPAVTSVAIVSSPASGEAYGRGETVEVLATFDRAVEVSGAPWIRLDVGGKPRTARYARGTGTVYIVFAYEVLSADSDADGIAIAADSIVRGGGTIGTVYGAAATLAHGAVAADAAQKVDGSATPPMGGICGRTDQVRDALLSLVQADDSAVADCGEVTEAHLGAVGALDLSDGSISALKAGDFAGLSGLTRLLLNGNVLTALPDAVFEPLAKLATLNLDGNPGLDGFRPAADAGPDVTVEAGETATLDGTASAGGPWGANVTYAWTRTDATGVVADLAGADTAAAVVTGPLLAAETALGYRLAVTGRGSRSAGEYEAADEMTAAVAANAVASVAIVSAPADGDAYGMGETVEVAATFAAPVAIRGAPGLTLDMGGTARMAAYARGAGTRLVVFAYAVASGDSDTDGIAIAADSIVLAGGDAIRNLHGVDAFLAHGAVAADAKHAVDGGAAPPMGGICGRTAGVRAALLALVQAADDTVSDCGDVTAAHLGAISALNLGDLGIAALKAGDFADLSGLTQLRLAGNALTTLPEGVFDPLTALTFLGLNGNALTALPAGAFDGPTGLTILNLSDNALTALPEGVFGPLGALIELYLSGNPGSGGFNPVANAGADLPAAEAGERVRLDGSASAGGPWGANVSYEWTLSPSSALDVTLTGADTLTPSFAAPRLAVAAELAFDLKVSGRGGRGQAYTATDSVRAPVAAAPALASVAIISAPANGDAYGMGEAVEVAATFTAPVEVSGTPGLVLDVGGTARTAGYARGTGTALVVFAYEVVSGDSDADGIAIAADSIVPGGGTIGNDHGGAAFLAHGAVAADAAQKVDGGAAPPTGGICGRTAGVRDALVALVQAADDTVSDCGDVTAAHLGAISALNLGDLGIAALKAGDFADLSGLTQLRLAGNALTTLPEGVFDPLTALTFLGLNGNALTALPAGAFDGPTGLTILNLSDNALTALPEGVFGPLGALIELYLSGNPGSGGFNPVANAGADLPAAEAGERVRLDGSASAGGPWGANVSYEWTLSPSSALDVTLTGADTLTPSFTAPRLAADVELEFDLKVSGRGGRGSSYTATDSVRAPVAAAPALASVAIISAPANGDAYGMGEAVEVLATFTAPVDVSGAPGLVLDVGGTARTAGYARGTGTALVVFAYEVASGDSDADGIEIAADSIVPGGGTIGNDHGADAFLAHGAVAADAAQKVVGTATPPMGGICGRTAGVRDALVALVQAADDTVSDCGDVTAAHLGAISAMNLGDLGIAALKAGDFADLSGLTQLRLAGNALTTLPEGVFDPLTALTFLGLNGNALTALPAGAFDGPTGLTHPQSERQRADGAARGRVRAARRSHRAVPVGQPRLRRLQSGGERRGGPAGGGGGREGEAGRERERGRPLGRQRQLCVDAEPVERARRDAHRRRHPDALVHRPDAGRERGARVRPEGLRPGWPGKFVHRHGQRAGAGRAAGAGAVGGIGRDRLGAGGRRGLRDGRGGRGAGDVHPAGRGERHAGAHARRGRDRAHGGLCAGRGDGAGGLRLRSRERGQRHRRDRDRGGQHRSRRRHDRGRPGRGRHSRARCGGGGRESQGDGHGGAAHGQHLRAHGRGAGQAAEPGAGRELRGRDGRPSRRDRGAGPERPRHRGAEGRGLRGPVGAHGARSERERADDTAGGRVRRAERADRAGPAGQRADGAAGGRVRRAERADDPLSAGERADGAAGGRVRRAERADLPVSGRQRADGVARGRVRAARRAHGAVPVGQPRLRALPSGGGRRGGPAGCGGGRDGDAGRERERGRPLGRQRQLCVDGQRDERGRRDPRRGRDRDAFVHRAGARRGR